MQIPSQLRYTKDHEWIESDPSGRLKVGITDYAQDALGDIVFVQLPEVGTSVQAGATFSEVESTKSVSDIYAPVAGKVVEVNHALSDSPQAINENPYTDGWICIIEPSGDNPADLMDASEYEALVNGAD
jgi:glycine cleavage system H protein